VKEQAPGEWVLEAKAPPLLSAQWHVAASSLLWLLLAGASATPVTTLAAALLLMLYSAHAWFGLATALLRRGRPARIVLAMRELRVPSWLLPGAERVIALSSVRGIELTRGRRRGVIVATGSGLPAWIGGRWFASQADAGSFVDLLAARAGPRVPVADRGRAWPRIAWLPVVAMLLLFALWRLLPVPPLLSLLAAGALNASLVTDGEWFRVMMAPFVHVNVPHLALVAALLWLLGSDVESRLGAAAGGFVVAASALGGGLAGWASREVLAFGGGALCYGLLGAHVVMWLVDRAASPPRLRAFPAWLPGALIVVEVLANAGSFTMRLGGLVAGAVATASIVLLARRPLPLLVLASAVLATAGAGVVAWATSGLPGALRLDSARQLAAAPGATAEEANLGAWLVATAPRADDALIRATLAAFARHAGDGAPEAFRDTLATLHHRAGNGEQAVAIASAVLERVPADAFATQLARFSLAAGSRVQETVAVVQREEDARICVGIGADGRFDVDVVALAADRIAGLARLPGVDARACFSSPAAWPADAALAVGRVARARGDAGGSVRVFTADAEMLALP
jgi:membrane associated rhomboid family serine protease